MIKFVKGDAVKHIDPNSGLIKPLLADGWVAVSGHSSDEEKPMPNKKVKYLKDDGNGS